MEFVFHGSTTVKNKTRRYTAVGVFDGSNAMSVGFSFCSPKDQYNRKKGLMIARGRAAKNPAKVVVIPDSILKLEKHNKEIARYFIAEVEAIVNNL